MPLPLRLSSLLLALCLVACDDASRFDRAEPGEALSAGATTLSLGGQNAFLRPAANLTPLRRLDFAVGNNFFRSPWVIAPSTTTARDGLGPLLNTNACQNCHIRNGRGHLPDPGDVNAVSALVRLSVPPAAGDDDTVHRLGVVPEPVYGEQLQDMAIPGIAPEGKLRVTYRLHEVRFDDGTLVQLREPLLDITQLNYGPMRPDTQFSLRVAPPMIGLGLLEAIPDAQILAHADPDDRDADGISGRPNLVWDEARQQVVLGRFGMKAGEPTLDQQNAHAFSRDLGLTTSLLPATDCTPAQSDCLRAADGGTPEVSDNLRAKVLFYTRNLAVPARRDVESPQVLAGKALFHQAGCAGCHVPTFTTAADASEPELANQVIHPYTDLLLHDMGDGLADNRPEFQASGREWRTPPLWGLGLTQAVSGRTDLLHDGRARSPLEAILWHGGEAEAARRFVLTFDAQQRAALLAFLNSL
jgi:CxxC motif-containing protein (DUF1111 family)